MQPYCKALPVNVFFFKCTETNMNTKSNFMKARHMCFKLDVFF